MASVPGVLRALMQPDDDERARQGSGVTEIWYSRIDASGRTRR